MDTYVVIVNNKAHFIHAQTIKELKEKLDRDFANADQVEFTHFDNFDKYNPKA